MANHPTITDKDRPAKLIGGITFQPITIRDRDGKIKKAIKPDLPGIYLVQYQLVGNSSDEYEATFRVDRYPFDMKDAGTAWDDVRIKKGRWHVTRGGIRITIHESGTYSTAIGLAYRIPTGAQVTIDQRIIKFTRISD